jgi:hypothetical protein
MSSFKVCLIRSQSARDIGKRLSARDQPCSSDQVVVEVEVLSSSGPIPSRCVGHAKGVLPWCVTRGTGSSNVKEERSGSRGKEGPGPGSCALRWGERQREAVGWTGSRALSEGERRSGPVEGDMTRALKASERGGELEEVLVMNSTGPGG